MQYEPVSDSRGTYHLSEMGGQINLSANEQ